jgi:hypothetical protein
MAFGQVSGPPATGKQLQELLGLLHEAGHSDFRDARGPMGFTQRQAGGKFTRTEAEAFIDQLREAAEAEAEADEIVGSAPAPSAPSPAAAPSPNARPKQPAVRLTAGEMAMRRIPSEQLAAELQRRGWVVMEP